MEGSDRKFKLLWCGGSWELTHRVLRHLMAIRMQFLSRRRYAKIFGDWVGGGESSRVKIVIVDGAVCFQPSNGKVSRKPL